MEGQVDRVEEKSGNLVLTVPIGQRVRVTGPNGETITFTPTSTKSGSIVKVSVKAPQSFRIIRPDAKVKRAAECVGRRIET